MRGIETGIGAANRCKPLATHSTVETVAQKGQPLVLCIQLRARNTYTYLVFHQSRRAILPVTQELLDLEFVISKPVFGTPDWHQYMVIHTILQHATTLMHRSKLLVQQHLQLLHRQHGLLCPAPTTCHRRLTTARHQWPNAGGCRASETRRGWQRHRTRLQHLKPLSKRKDPSAVAFRAAQMLLHLPLQFAHTLRLLQLGILCRSSSAAQRGELTVELTKTPAAPLNLLTGRRVKAPEALLQLVGAEVLGMQLFAKAFDEAGEFA
mmetsp:Transcript_126344/g.404494  ORF Transcript_126344/g.404494 Transcript_126344/m.404494 type:complete len:265 (+) Transcript_126344:813-1607(+)